MKKLNKRILSALLAMLMFLNSCPISAFAGDLKETVPEITQSTKVTEPAKPAATEPPATESAATKPAATEPAPTKPASTEPAVTDPGTTEPAATEPGTTEPAATEPGTTEPAATEPGTTEPAATEPGTTEPAATEPDTTEPAVTEPVATEPADNCPYCEDTIGEDGETVHASDCNIRFKYNGTEDVAKFAKFTDTAKEHGVNVSKNHEMDHAVHFAFSDFEEDTLLHVTGWYWDPDTSALWYRVNFYSGTVNAEAEEAWPAPAWVLDQYTNPARSRGVMLSLFKGCGICSLPACETEHTKCEICGAYDCAVEHIACEICGIYDCVAEHVLCVFCKKYDCDMDHSGDVQENIMTSTGSVESNNEHESAVGKYAVLNEAATVFTVHNEKTGEIWSYYHEDFKDDTILRIVDWKENDEGLWYLVEFYAGGIVESSFTTDFPANPWFLQTEDALIFVTCCDTCGKPDCDGNHEPETVPSISHSGGITVSSESGIPADSTVSMADYSTAGDGSGKVYDIKVLNADGTKWQPAPGEAVRVSMPVSIAHEGTVSVAHILEDAEQIAYGLEKGTVKVQNLADVDDSFKSLLSNAAAAYESATGSNSAVAYELFENVPVVNGYATVSACGFSIFILGEDGNYTEVKPDWNSMTEGVVYYMMPADTYEFENDHKAQWSTYWKCTVEGVLSRNSSNGIFGIGAYDRVRITAPRTVGQQFDVTYGGKTITFKVGSSSELGEETVAIAIYRDSGFPAEPLVDGTGRYYRYLGKSSNLSTSSYNTDYAESTDGIIDVKKFLSSELRVEHIDSQGREIVAVIDSTGQKTLQFVNFSDDLKTDLIEKYLDQGNIDGKAEDYEFLIYVVKREFQGNEYKWYINGKVVEKDNYLVTYRRHVPNGFSEFSVSTFPNNQEVSRNAASVKLPGTGAVTSPITATIGNTTAEARFIGWSTDESATTAQYQPGETITNLKSDLELFAVWEITGVVYEASDIRISKWVVLHNSGEADYADTEDYTFTLTGDGLAGKQYYLHDYSGTQMGEEDVISASPFTFTLKNGYTIVVPGVPQGTYTVTEAEKTGYLLDDESTRTRTFTFGKDAINTGNYQTTYVNRKLQYFTISFYDGLEMTTLVNPNPVRSEAGREVKLETNIVKPGYDFIGWMCEEDNCADCTGANPQYHTGSIIMPAKNIEMYSQWTPHTYEVAFDGNGATGGTMTNQPFTYGEEQNLTANRFEKKYTVTYDANGGTDAPAPAVAQATFTGWKNGNATYSNGQSVKNLTTEDNGVYTMTAQWDPGSVTLPELTREGHTFSGWYKDEDLTVSAGEAGATYTPADNETLYAKWTPFMYTVKVELNTDHIHYTGLDGFEMVDGCLQKQVAYGTEINASFAAKTGCELQQIQIAQTEGDPDHDGRIEHVVTSDILIQVKSARIRYSVVFLNEDGTLLQSSELEYGTIPVYTGALPTKATTAQYTYTFADWTPQIVPVTDTAIYTATYTSRINEYIVTFDANGGIIADIESTRKIPYGSAYGVLPVPNRIGHEFAGWFTAAEGGKEVAADDTFTFGSDTTLYAHWTPRMYEVKFSYVVPTSTNPISPSQTIAFAYGTTIDNFDQYIKDVPGYRFVEAYPASYTVNAEAGQHVDLIYEEIEVVINYVAKDGGTVSPTEQTVKMITGVNWQNPASTAIPDEGYHLVGWYADEECTNLLSTNATFTPAKNGTVWEAATYYAKFEINTYKITFQNEDGTELQSGMMEYGAMPVYNGATPTKTPAENDPYTYRFAGWMPEIQIVTGEVVYQATYDTLFDFKGTIDHGTISYDGVSVSNVLVRNDAVKGSDVGKQMTFKPEPGYQIKKVSINGVGQTVTLESDGSYVHTFEQGMQVEEKLIEVETEQIEVVINIQFTDGSNLLEIKVQKYSDVLLAITPKDGTQILAIELTGSESDGVTRVTDAPNGYIYTVSGITESMTIVVEATTRDVFCAAASIDHGTISLKYGDTTVTSKQQAAGKHMKENDAYTFTMTADEERHITRVDNTIFGEKPQEYSVAGVVNGHKIVLAQTEKISYNLTYILDNGSDNWQASAAYGNVVNLREAPVKDGYTFLGWWYNKNGDTAVDTDELFAAGDPFPMPDHDVTVTARWVDSRLDDNRVVYVGINMSFYDNNGSWYYKLPTNEPAVIHGLTSVRMYKDTFETTQWKLQDFGDKFSQSLPGAPGQYITEDVFDTNLGYVNNMGTSGAEGIFDPTGTNTRKCLTFSEADYAGIIQGWLNRAENYLQYQFPNIKLDWTAISKDADDYTIMPYVVKRQSNGNWYVDMVIQPKAKYTVTYKMNLENGYTSEKTEFVDNTGYGEGFQAEIKNPLKAVNAERPGTEPRFKGWWYDEDADGAVDKNELRMQGTLLVIPDHNVEMIAQWEYPKRLKIIETSGKDDDTFFFDVVGKVGNETVMSMTVSVQGGGYVIVDGIFAAEYTVTERNKWSWTYETGTIAITKTVTAGETGDTVFEFGKTFKKPCWLFAENHN